MRGPIVVFVIALAVVGSTATFPQRVYADDSAALSKDLARKMRQHQVVKGRFEQWRNLTGIPRPIHSSGRFIYWRDHGLYWETRKPISQAATFTPDTTIYWQPGSGARQTGQRADKSSSPIQKQITRILLAVFGGDMQSLETLFDSHWSTGTAATENPWTVDLTPTMAAIGRIVEKISLSGGDYVNSLSLDASNGDTTQIQFTDIRALSRPAADDCQYFDLDSSSCPGHKDSPPTANQSTP